MPIEREYCTGCKKNHDHDVEYKTKLNGELWRDGKCSGCGNSRQLPHLNGVDEDQKFWIGKHKGKTYKEVPTEYLQWFLDNTDSGYSTKKRIQNVLARRVDNGPIESEPSLFDEQPKVKNMGNKFELFKRTINSLGLTDEQNNILNIAVSKYLGV